MDEQVHGHELADDVAGRHPAGRTVQLSRHRFRVSGDLVDRVGDVLPCLPRILAGRQGLRCSTPHACDHAPMTFDHVSHDVAGGPLLARGGCGLPLVGHAATRHRSRSKPTGSCPGPGSWRERTPPIAYAARDELRRGAGLPHHQEGYRSDTPAAGPAARPSRSRPWPRRPSTERVATLQEWPDPHYIVTWGRMGRFDFVAEVVEAWDPDDAMATAAELHPELPRPGSPSVVSRHGASGLQTPIRSGAHGARVCGRHRHCRTYGGWSGTPAQGHVARQRRVPVASATVHRAKR